MRGIYLLLIFLAAFAGGAVPLWRRRIPRETMTYLLTFTGAFLLGITVLHLLPESFEALGKKAGLYMLAGFFLQVFLQRWSHGLEHGHGYTPVKSHGDGASATLAVSHGSALSLIVGLSVHAFMAGLPLGFTYSDLSTLPSLALGILLHKMPEALTLMTMLVALQFSRKKNWLLLVLFSLVTPAGALLALALNVNFAVMDTLLLYIIAIVAGAFLHISTTIFFESGTRHHELNRGKIISMVLGLILSSLTLLFPS
jgi:zinc transporter ZupT